MQVDGLLLEHLNNLPQKTDSAGGARSHIDATNDVEATRVWLAEYTQSEATLRSYRKEIERFLLWCQIEKQKSVSQLLRQDFDDYFSFVKNPMPRERWCAPRGSAKRMRGSAGWRPFVGPLTPRAIATAMSVISSFMGYLADARYIDGNPMLLIRRKGYLALQKNVRAFEVQARILEDDEWAAYLAALDALPEESAHDRDEKVRARFLVAILFFLGLRIEELANHPWNAFRQVAGAWWFFVRGKGGKLAKVPVNEDLLSEIRSFRTHFALSPLPFLDDDGAIIRSFVGTEALSTRQMAKILKRVALKAAEVFADEPTKRAKMRRFSPHWLRHLSASMQDRAGIQFKHIRGNLRHERDDTTRLYVHADDHERHSDMSKLKWVR